MAKTNNSFNINKFIKGNEEESKHTLDSEPITEVAVEDKPKRTRTTTKKTTTKTTATRKRTTKIGLCK